MRLLFIDTATEACSAALIDGASVHGRFEVVGRTHTQSLMPMVQGLMQQAGMAFSQLDAIACGVGPGSFAGVRIATGFVKGLALALDRPVVAVNSLEMLAQAAIDSGATNVLAAIDARMDEVYFASFERGADGLARARGDLQIGAATDVVAEVRAPAVGVGSAWQRHGAALQKVLGAVPLRIDANALPDCRAAIGIAVARLASGELLGADALAPLYLRNKVALTLEEQVALRAARKQS